MKNILVLLLSISFALCAHADEKFEITFQKGETKRSISNKLGISSEFFDELFTDKIATLAYMGECSLNINQSAEVLSVMTSSTEDVAKEELSYVFLSVEFNKVTLNYSLLKVDGASIEFNSVISTDFQCK